MIWVRLRVQCCLKSNQLWNTVQSRFSDTFSLSKKLSLNRGLSPNKQYMKIHTGIPWFSKKLSIVASVIVAPSKGHAQYYVRCYMLYICGILAIFTTAFAKSQFNFYTHIILKISSLILKYSALWPTFGITKNSSIVASLNFWMRLHKCFDHIVLPQVS